MIGTICIFVGVILLILLKLFFKDEANIEESSESHDVQHEDLLKEEPEFDRTWSFLPGNIFNRFNND